MVERGRTKCAQYWGPEPGDEVQAGGFTVTTLEVDTNPDYTISMLLLTNNKVCVDAGLTFKDENENTLGCFKKVSIDKYNTLLF